MNQRLFKILEGQDTVDVSKLSEENIGEYLQAVRTVDRLNGFIVDPFVESAKQQTTMDEPLLYDANGVKINLFERKVAQKHSAKTVVELLKDNLRMSRENNCHGMSAYGVRRFDCDLAVDARYLSRLVGEWKEAVTGHTVSHRVSYSGDGVKTLAKNNYGNLIMVDSPVDFSNIGEQEVALYLAADMQVKALGQRVVTPFVNVFKKLGEKTGRTNLSLHDYGGLSVLVETVPRFEADYSRVLGAVKDHLDLVSTYGEGDVDQVHTFFNRDLCEPRAYISIDALTEGIEAEERVLSRKYRQDVSVLYRPDPATVLVMD